jgi:hypothetical protein
MKFPKLAVLVCAAFVAGITASHAATISDPVKFVRSVYAALAAEKTEPKIDGFNTPRLQALYDLNSREFGKDEVGRIDFDIFMNAQDGKFTDIRVTGTPVENGAGREVVTAKFRNLGKRQEVHFYFEKIRGHWLLDDASSWTQPQPWVLSLLLKYGWDGSQ